MLIYLQMTYHFFHQVKYPIHQQHPKFVHTCVLGENLILYHSRLMWPGLQKQKLSAQKFNLVLQIVASYLLMPQYLKTLLRFL